MKEMRHLGFAQKIHIPTSNPKHAPLRRAAINFGLANEILGCLRCVLHFGMIIVTRYLYACLDRGAYFKLSYNCYKNAAKTKWNRFKHARRCGGTLPDAQNVVGKKCFDVQVRADRIVQTAPTRRIQAFVWLD